MGALKTLRLWTIIKNEVLAVRKLKPVTPGELLMEEFIKPMGISRYRLAKEIGVPPQRVGDIVGGQACHYCGHRPASLPPFLGFRADTGFVPRQLATQKLRNMLCAHYWKKLNLGTAFIYGKPDRK
jgi:hypothetical protein